MKTNICKFCGKVFNLDKLPSGRYSKKSYCSRDCEVAFNRSKPRIKLCKQCGKEFNAKLLPSGEFSKSQFCSDVCSKAYYEDKYAYVNCSCCGMRFKREKVSCGDYSQARLCPICTEKSKHRVCIICGEDFIIPSDRARTKICNRCYHKMYFRFCKGCGKEFEIPRTEEGKLNSTIYCPDCTAKNYDKAHFGTCKVCGKKFEYPVVRSGYISKNMFCSDECWEVAYNKNKKHIQEKRTKTVLQRYGVSYSVLMPSCRKANKNIISNINIAFANRLEDLGISVDRLDDGTISELNLGVYSYDLHITGSNILIELNPTFTHTCADTGVFSPKTEQYHIDKLSFAYSEGYRCVCVWDWDDKDKVAHLFTPKTKLYARKLELKVVEKQKANVFLNNYHLQGFCYGNSVNLGLYLGEQLIQVMTFGKPRYNKNYQWELLRLCTDDSYFVIGGAERLFEHFIRDYQPDSIISYCDVSKFSGDVYKRLGFSLKEQTKPQKIWNKRNSTQFITDNLLRQKGFDILIGSKLSPPEIYGKGTDNEMLMLSHGWLPVYDCGQKVFEYQK